MNSSLRNSQAVKSDDGRHLKKENRLLKVMVLNLSFELCELKKH